MQSLGSWSDHFTTTLPSRLYVSVIFCVALFMFLEVSLSYQELWLILNPFSGFVGKLIVSLNVFNLFYLDSIGLQTAANFAGDTAGVKISFIPV